METFSALLALCAGNSPVIGEFPAQRPVMRSFDISFDLRLNKRLSKHLETGDLRRYRAHYDITVMQPIDLTAINDHKWPQFQTKPIPPKINTAVSISDKASRKIS